jgi:hypothetical protein
MLLTFGLLLIAAGGLIGGLTAFAHPAVTPNFVAVNNEVLLDANELQSVNITAFCNPVLFNKQGQELDVFGKPVVYVTVEQGPDTGRPAFHEIFGFRSVPCAGLVNRLLVIPNLDGIRPFRFDNTFTEMVVTYRNEVTGLLVTKFAFDQQFEFDT